jgi:hypothetical protein
MLSNDERVDPKESKKAKGAPVVPAKPIESKSRKRGGAVAAPRAKRAAPKADAAPKAEVKTEDQKVKRRSKKAAAEEKSGDE